MGQNPLRLYTPKVPSWIAIQQEPANGVSVFGSVIARSVVALFPSLNSRQQGQLLAATAPAELGCARTWWVGAGGDGTRTGLTAAGPRVLLLRVLRKWSHSLLTTFRTFCMCHGKEVLRDVFFFSEEIRPWILRFVEEALSQASALKSAKKIPLYEGGYFFCTVTIPVTHHFLVQFN